MKRDFVNFEDLNREEILEVLEYADFIKKNPYSNDVLKNKSIGLIFMKQSTRTRLSFEVGVHQLGGQPIYILGSSTQLSRGEDIKDTARVMSRYLDGIVIRTYSHQEVEDLAKYGSIPVINALTDYQHPCQVLADLQTIKERFGKLEGLRLTYIGDGNNMANTLLIACAMMGINISVATPEMYEPNGKAVKKAIELSKKTKVDVEIINNPEEAVKNSDVLYTDVWVSMGQEGETEKKKDFEGFTINKELVNKANKNAVVMHCLPAHKGEEISEDMFEQFSDVIFDQAENRLHSQKALLNFLYKGGTT